MKKTKKQFIEYLATIKRDGQKEYRKDKSKFNSDYVEWCEKDITEAESSTKETAEQPVIEEKEVATDPAIDEMFS